MSKHHCWYVTGRTLRLAVAFVLLASLVVANPAFAAEDTVLAAQKAAISNGRVTAVGIAATAPSSAGAEQESLVNSVASKEAADLDLLTPAAGNKVDGVIVLPKTGEAYPAVLELVRSGRTIAPVILGWEKDFEYFLPVKGMADALRFPSAYDAASQKIEGEFFNPQNRYSIDLAAGTYTVLGETYPLDKGDVFIDPENPDTQNDIYASLGLLNKIWSLELSIDPLSQTIAINLNRKLPVELEEDRKRQKAKLEREKREEEEAKKFQGKYVYTPNGYRILGPQTLYLSQNLEWNNPQKTLRNTAFIGGQGDLLGTSASYSANISKSSHTPLDFEDFTLRFTRKDYKSGKLLPLGLNRVDVGDISVRTPSLVYGSLQGTGVFLSTDRNSRDIDFDRITIEGQGTPGWDVEVYSRGTLIDYGSVDALGRYRFEDVPLTFGNNPIRLVFYGPQGQIEERTEEYSIAQSFLKPGEMTYQAGIVKRGNRLINVNENRKNDGETTSTYRVNRGINRYLSGYATFTNLPSNDEDKKYVSLGANFSAFGGWGQAEAYKSLESGTAFDIRYLKDFLGFDTSISSSLYRDFESIRAGTGSAQKETESNISVNRRFGKVFPAYLGFSLDHITYTEDPTETRLGTSQSFGSFLGNFSNTTSTVFTGSQTKNSTGELAFNRSLGKIFGFNTRLSYDNYPENQLNSLNLSLSYSKSDKFSASLTYGQSLLNTNSRSLSLGASYDFDTFAANANIGWATDNGISFTVGTSTTLGPQGEENLYKFRREIAGQPTRLAVRLYEDINTDGVFDDGDNPVPGARVILGNGKLSGLSDENGYIEIAPAGGEGLATIKVEQKSLTYNPFLISEKKDGHLTILRAGTKPQIDFPLIMSGTIDGAIRDADGKGMTGITVQLINEYGELVAENTSVIDGYYSFELVRPGRYVVQISPSHRVFVPPKTVRVASDDLFAYGVDLQVLSNQDVEQAAEAAVADDVGESGRVAHTYHHSAATVGTEMPAPVVTSGGGVQSAVRAVRFGEHSDKVRLVLDLSGPAAYQISKDDNGSVITVDLPDTQWEAGYDTKPGKKSLLQDFTVEQLPGGGTRIKLTGKSKIDVFYNAALPAEAGSNDRIYIDFIKAR